jgi:putative transposase
MPGQLRIQYPGAMYHVMSRGNRRAAIFLDDVDRQDFLKALAEACQKTSWQIHAYCLMSNHYHLVRETPNANLVAGMAWFQSTYTIRLNHRRGWCLGAPEFKARMLEQTEGQLGEHHFGELRRETAEAKGQRIIAEELGRLGWKEADFATRRKSDPAKLQIAARLRKETTLSIKQIAGCLHLGTPRSASVGLHTVMRGTAPAGSVQACL